MTAPGNTLNYSPAESRMKGLNHIQQLLLKQAGFDQSKWVLARECATFIRNRTPKCSNYANKTPYENIFFGKAPDLSSMRAFGCPCFIHIPSAQRKAWDDAARPGIFVGYSEKRRAYKILEPGRNQISFARSVIFNEAKLVQRLSHGLCPDESPGHSHDDNEADFDFVPVIPELFSETKWPEQAVQLEKKASRKSQTPAIPRSISFSENISPSEPKLTDNRLRGKHSRLRRELSLAIQTSTQQCNVVHSAESDIHELSDSDSDSDDISSCPVSLCMHFGKHDRFLDSSWGENAPDMQTCTSLINIAMEAEVSVVDPKNNHKA